jgi:hypothetical protein
MRGGRAAWVTTGCRWVVASALRWQSRGIAHLRPNRTPGEQLERAAAKVGRFNAPPVAGLARTLVVAGGYAVGQTLKSGNYPTKTTDPPGRGNPGGSL